MTQTAEQPAVAHPASKKTRFLSRAWWAGTWWAGVSGITAIVGVGVAIVGVFLTLLLAAAPGQGGTTNHRISPAGCAAAGHTCGGGRPATTPSMRHLASPECAAGSLQLIGSTAFAPIAQEVADAYMRACPGATITVTGGDSAYGLTKVRDAVASGSPSAGTMIALYDGSSSASAGLRPYPIGALIFSVVAHTNATLFPGLNITTSELRNIFVKPGEHGIIAVGRRAGSGSRKAFIANVLGVDPGPPDEGNCPAPTGSAFYFTSCTEDSTADLLNFVDETPNAIGFAEVFRPLTGYPQVSVLSIDNAEPTPDNVRNGSYHFWAVEHLYAAMQPAVLTKYFLEFLPRYLESNTPSDYIPCSPELGRLGADC